MFYNAEDLSINSEYEEDSNHATISDDSSDREA